MASEPQRAAADQRREMQERITEIRKASFANARKGYDKAQVRHYLEAVADWLEGLGLGDADRGEMRRELAWVGERTSEILTKAEETASELREQGKSESQKLRADAEAATERLRAEADEESRRVRMEAATEAERLVAEAERRAESIVDEANRRRQDLQALIGDLLVRRDEIVADGVRLADELTILFSTAIDVPDEGAEDEVDEGDVADENEGEVADEDQGDEPVSQRTRRFDPASLDDSGDTYDEDGVRVPLEDDDAPAASWPGETMESDAIPEPEDAADPDTEEQRSTR